MFTETFLSDDNNVPDRIEHGCDVIIDSDGKLEQYYNYLDYHFSGVGHGLSARSYLDEINVVSIHGFAREGSREMISLSAFDSPKGREILLYLHRRYAMVRLGFSGPTLAPPND